MVKKLVEIVLASTPLISMYFTSEILKSTDTLQINDAFFTFGTYYFFKALDANISKNPLINASFTFLIASGIEITQYLGWVSGNFNENDFYSYIAGCFGALIIDSLFFKNKKSKKKSYYEQY